MLLQVVSREKSAISQLITAENDKTRGRKCKFRNPERPRHCYLTVPVYAFSIAGVEVAIASAAKQSLFSCALDCFVVSLLAMTCTEIPRMIE
jgi:hypothetical protein